MNNQDKRILGKYLNNYGRSIDLTHFPDSLKWKYVVILPVCAESAQSIPFMFQNLQNSSVLLVVVLNRPEQHEKSDLWQHQNTIFKKTLQSVYSEEFNITDEHSLFTDAEQPDALLLDFNEKPFHHNDGVGLARRIGSDTAAALIELGVIKNPWLFSTDADVELPLGYFDVFTEDSEATAFSLNFKHVSDDSELVSYQEKYDFKLRYYRKGVQYIGSDYAYIPLGSTLVINVISYAKVRGFPCRSGGEDFYLLNKLAKIGEVIQPKYPIINIRIRQSDRVPFGTGPAVTKIKEQIKLNNEILYYHPKVFIRLKNWRQDLLVYFENRIYPTDTFLNDHWSIDTVFQKALKNIHSTKRWQQFIHEWFDAFKILKSVHFLGKFHHRVTQSELFTLSQYFKINS